MKNSYCVEVQSSFCENSENGEMELEVHFNDNKGMDFSSYKRGTDGNALINDVVEDLLNQYEETLKALKEPEKETPTIDKKDETINRLLSEIEALSKKATKLQKENELLGKKITEMEQRESEDDSQKKEEDLDLKGKQFLKNLFDTRESFFYQFGLPVKDISKFL